MLFSVSGNEYDRFMGRYSTVLAPAFATFAEVGSGTRVLDVGCGTGALTAELVRRTSADLVFAVDPAPQFVEVCRERAPGANVRVCSAERLPFGDGEFDRVVSQLVLPFFADADAAMAEMRRVARPFAIVSACMWGSDDEMGLVGSFWRAAIRLDASQTGDRLMRFRDRAETEALFQRAGFTAVESAPLDVSSTYESFEEYWQSILGAAGTVGAYVSELSPVQLSALRDSCRDELGAPKAPFTLPARAWAVKAKN
jgi:SAM-dependent methyltransferase